MKPKIESTDLIGYHQFGFRSKQRYQVYRSMDTGYTDSKSSRQKISLFNVFLHVLAHAFDNVLHNGLKCGS